MMINNVINGVISKLTASSTSNFVVNIPSKINNILIVYSNLSSSDMSGNGYLSLLTAPSSGVFASSGYRSGIIYTLYNSNAWTNSNSVTYIHMSGGISSTTAIMSGAIYVTNFNTSSSVQSFGNCIGSGTGTVFFDTVGSSPTTSATMIKILISGVVATMTGSITVYSLL
ncbi:MAG: hypothetical protein K2X08_05845 [Chlamydiales bacterium]|nr:hypothetical protein [Chlamydiales bacterium]